MKNLLETLTPYYQKGLTDKEIAKEVRKPVGTIRMYRGEYEKVLFSKIQPTPNQLVEEVKNSIAAVDFVEGCEILKSDCKQAEVSEREEKVTKKDIAFDLFAQGMSVDEIMQLTGLSYNSVVTYRTQYNKSLKEVADPVKPQNELTTGSEVTFEVGSTQFTTNIYVDMDGCEWVYLPVFNEIIKKELNMELKNTPLHAKYTKVFNFNESPQLFIDKYALPIIAKEVGDFRLTSSIMDCISPKRDIFTKAHDIIKALKETSAMIDSINGIYKDIEAYNKAQQDLLHDIEKHDYDDEELVRKVTAIRDLRRCRRVSKNELTIIKNIKNNLYNARVYPNEIRKLETELSELVEDLYLKKYNSRVDELDEDQKETIANYVV